MSFWHQLKAKLGPKNCFKIANLASIFWFRRQRTPPPPFFRQKSRHLSLNGAIRTQISVFTSHLIIEKRWILNPHHDQTNHPTLAIHCDTKNGDPLSTLWGEKSQNFLFEWSENVREKKGPPLSLPPPVLKCSVCRRQKNDFFSPQYLKIKSKMGPQKWRLKENGLPHIIGRSSGPLFLKFLPTFT